MYANHPEKVAPIATLPAANSLLSLKVHDLSDVEQTAEFDDNQHGSEESPTENAVFLPRVLLIAFLMLSGSTLALAKDIALVSNKTGSVGAVTMVELVKLCKAQTNRWPDGKSVTIFVRDPASPDMRVVLEKIYAASASELNDLIAATNRGRASHPAIVVVASDDELVRRVATTPGAIGLVDVYAINSSVEVVKIAGKLPFVPGYPLHGN